jgi:sodium/proline symporter
MNSSAVVYTVVLAYCALLIAIGAWASRRSHNAADFFIASRRLALMPAAFGAALNIVPPIVLLMIVALAFKWGVAAVWIPVTLLFGLALNYFFVAPRLQLLAVDAGVMSIVQLLTVSSNVRMQSLIARSATFILMVCMTLLVVTHLQLAGLLLDQFRLAGDEGGLWMVAIVVILTMLGGVWSTSSAALLQAVTLLGIIVFADVAAIRTIGNFQAFMQGAHALSADALDWSAGRPGIILPVTFVLGTLGIGLGSFGQPQVLSHFIARTPNGRDYLSRTLSLLWSVVVLGGALLLGWSAKVLYAGLPGDDLILLSVLRRVFSPTQSLVAMALFVCSLLCSIASYLMVMSSSLRVDLGRQHIPLSSVGSRVLIPLGAVFALLLAYRLPTSMSSYLFAWNVIGATFGALLLVRLTGKRTRAGSLLGGMWAGCLLTVLFHILPSGPGEFLGRVLPFVAALGIALTGGERRRNPDRADRSDSTVHDHVPI